MWVVEEVIESQPRAEQDPSPTHSTTMERHGLTHPGEYLRLCHLLSNRHTETKNMAQMKEHIKAPKTELSNEEIANLLDAEFKTLVIRMLTEMVEYGCKIEEKTKAMKSEYE